MDCKTDIKPRMWYNSYKFPLVPVFNKRKGDDYNTVSYSFDWLFIKLWTLDSFDFEFSFVASYHWGIGIIGILPYLRWAITIPFPNKLEEWTINNLWRKPKIKYGII